MWEDQIVMEGKREGGKERDRVSEDSFSVVHSFLHSHSRIRDACDSSVASR